MGKQAADKQSYGSSKGTSTKPIVVQLALADSSTYDISNLSKDQIAEVIAYFNSKLNTLNAQVNYMASSSGGTITTLPGIAYSNSTQQFVGMLRLTRKTLSSESWIVDSGANHHVCHDRRLFADLSDAVNTSVPLPTGFGVKFAGIGSIRLNDYIILSNVLFIFNFRLNLLSVSQLTKDLGCHVSFNVDSCQIQDHTKGLMIGRAEQISNLYVLDIEDIADSGSLQHQFAICSNVVVDTNLWHNRLGHPSISKTDANKSTEKYK